LGSITAVIPWELYLGDGREKYTGVTRTLRRARDALSLQGNLKEWQMAWMDVSLASRLVLNSQVASRQILRCPRTQEPRFTEQAFSFRVGLARTRVVLFVFERERTIVRQTKPNHMSFTIPAGRRLDGGMAEVLLR
jgi:hypothetical protein